MRSPRKIPNVDCRSLETSSVETISKKSCWVERQGWVGASQEKREEQTVWAKTWDLWRYFYLALTNDVKDNSHNSEVIPVIPSSKETFFAPVDLFWDSMAVGGQHPLQGCQ